MMNRVFIHKNQRVNFDTICQTSWKIKGVKFMRNALKNRIKFAHRMLLQFCVIIKNETSMFYLIKAKISFNFAHEKIEGSFEI